MTDNIRKNIICKGPQASLEADLVSFVDNDEDVLN